MQTWKVQDAIVDEPLDISKVIEVSNTGDATIVTYEVQVTLHEGWDDFYILDDADNKLSSPEYSRSGDIVTIIVTDLKVGTPQRFTIVCQLDGVEIITALKAHTESGESIFTYGGKQVNCYVLGVENKNDVYDVTALYKTSEYEVYGARIGSTTGEEVSVYTEGSKYVVKFDMDKGEELDIYMFTAIGAGERLRIDLSEWSWVIIIIIIVIVVGAIGVLILKATKKEEWEGMETKKRRYK